MTAADYLTARGWTYCPEDENFEGGWYDPQHYGGMTPRHSREKWSYLPEDEALIIQRARDEEKAAEAWVRFAAYQAVITDAPTAAEVADRMLALYRERFGEQP